MGLETGPGNELVKYAICINEADMYPLMVLVAFKILQGDGDLYGIVVSLQSRQLLDQVCSVVITVDSGGILYASTIQLRLAEDINE